MEQTQTFQNHTRWFPLVHFVLMPILAINLIWQVVRAYQDFNWDRAENILIAVALLILGLAARLQALKAQDRVIRLEEKLRFRDVLSPEMAAKADNLTTGQLISLRFASDEELSDLVNRTVNGEFKNSKEIKLSIKNWRGDYLRV